MDRRAWWATVHRVAEGQTQQKQLGTAQQIGHIPERRSTQQQSEMQRLNRSTQHL